MARPSRASAAASASPGSLSRMRITVRSRRLPAARRPPAPAERAGEGGRPRCPAGRGRLRRRPVAAPLRRRQHGIGVGLLLKHEAAVLPALGAAAHPIEDAKLAQPLERRGAPCARTRSPCARSPHRTGRAGRCGSSGSRRSARAALAEPRAPRLRRGGPCAGSAGRSRARGAIAASRPSSASAGSGFPWSCCLTTPARRHRSSARQSRAGQGGSEAERRHEFSVRVAQQPARKGPEIGTKPPVSENRVFA